MTALVQPETSLNQCLQDLRTTDPRLDKDRILELKGGLLIDSYSWVLDNEEFQQWQDNQSNCLFWIRGDPGKGKTMLLCGIIDKLTRSTGDNTNISFFFCEATNPKSRNATAVLRGLIYSLVDKQPSLLSHVQSQYNKAGKALFEDINAWNALSRIFADILNDPSLKRTYLIIDALDECTTDLDFLLHLVVRESRGSPQVKWIVSSRNRFDIEQHLNIAAGIDPFSLELNKASVSEAVENFIQRKVDDLATLQEYSDETRDAISCYLSSNSQGTFLWVALVCQGLERSLPWLAREKMKAFPPGLNALYGRMIDQVHNSGDAETCKRILAVMSTVYRPITFHELPSLIELPDYFSDCPQALSQIIAICGSFLTVHEDTIVFVHQSAKEFLLEETQNGIFPRGIEAEHCTIFSRSLQAMFKTLRRDIFQLRSPGFPIEKVIPPSPNPLAAIEYACVFWVDHLQDSGFNQIDETGISVGWSIETFLQQKYLQWIEALSILKSLSYGISAMLKLVCLVQVRAFISKVSSFSNNIRITAQDKDELNALLDRVQDASRFIQYHRIATESCPLQVYYSPLIFSPTQSLTRTCYQKETPNWFLNQPVVERSWSSCLQTLEGHSGSVNSIAWSHDGSLLASASEDETVRIWNPATGQHVLTLQGHNERVSFITWSQDGSRIASLSGNMTVKVWDPVTGYCLSTLKHHRDHVYSIAWFQDGSRLASVSNLMTVKIWDPATGKCLSTPRGDNHSISSSRLVAWSQDRKRLASAYYGNTLRIWDLTTGHYVSTLEGHRNSVHEIAWSEDGTRLASASEDRSVKIWNSTTGDCLSTLEEHCDYVYSVAWSQDGSRLASASRDMTVKIWDLLSTRCTSTLKGHSDTVFSVAWLQDGSRLASGSADRTVRIWDPAIGRFESISDGHSGPIRSISWSQDGNRLASASDDKTVKIWDPATGQCLTTLEGHGGQVRSIAWSQHRSQLASGSIDKTIRIWDMVTNKTKLILQGYSGPINSVSWSPDGSKLASTSDDDETIRIWDQVTNQFLPTLGEHSDTVLATAWSRDGNRLASASHDETVMIWDLATGRRKATHKGHTGSVHSIAWSQDGNRLASASDETVKIWDPATGHCQLSLLISSPYFLHFDHLNPNHLQTRRGTVNIGPATSAPSSAPYLVSLPQQNGPGLNDDHSWITFNGAHLLWLPTEYRPTFPDLFVISAKALAIGCSSGRVIFFNFTEQSNRKQPPPSIQFISYF